MTKMQLLKKIDEVDNKMLSFCNEKHKLHPFKLKKAELERLLDAFETMYELYTKMQ